MSPELPGSYVNLLIDVVKKWNISPEQMLAGTGIQVQKLEAPFWYVDMNIFNYLLEKAATLTKEPAMSLYLAQDMRASCYGNVGIAATAAQTLSEAIEILEQFIGLHCAVFKPRLKIDGEMAYLYFSQPLRPERLNPHAICFLIFGFAQILESLAQVNLEIRYKFQQDKPDFYRNIHSNKYLSVDFAAEADCLIFKKQCLDIPLKTSDPLLARLSRQQCQQDAQKLAQKRMGKDRLDAVIKAMIYDEQDGFLSIKQIAGKLHISERSLQRQLGQQQTTFQTLLAEVRRQHAEYLLRQPKLSIQEVADRLGYADISHFSRAFKRWTNVTPKFYREVSKALIVN
ncbi:helix-turn-helix domain-containing protein [Acinetobacter vivianii]|uniref:helix-turn-helix domain-containing protein n=1 Tax=Acinetobacter vivianii TaxID=1776742 RepID=UPI002DBFA8B7|nr:helix-turn-helix domain-containing protein [Acinetobacter vivianii]MEB6478851.1 AraC family transcriptional regulator [Acinetobacter vivianii]MEB6657317.1 AraC family transcriptional regulator [Acinetobacter vivianii]